MTEKTYILDFRKVQDGRELHQIIRKSLEFPDHYGCNWSAFWDCLTDLYGGPIHIKIVGFEVVEEKFEGSARQMLSILERFKHFEECFTPEIRIEIVRHGTVTIIE